VIILKYVTLAHYESSYNTGTHQHFWHSTLAIDLNDV